MKVITPLRPYGLSEALSKEVKAKIGSLANVRSMKKKSNKITPKLKKLIQEVTKAALISKRESDFDEFDIKVWNLQDAVGNLVEELEKEYIIRSPSTYSPKVSSKL